MAKRPAPPILSQRRPSAVFQNSHPDQSLPLHPDHSECGRSIRRFSKTSNVQSVSVPAQPQAHLLTGERLPQLLLFGVSHRLNGKGSKKVDLELTRVTSRGASNDQISSSSFFKLKVTRYPLEPLGISYSNVKVQPWVIREQSLQESL